MTIAKPLRKINTEPMTITYRDVLDLAALAYYQGLIVAMTKGTPHETDAPELTLIEMSRLRAFLGDAAAQLGDEFMAEKLGLTVSELSNMQPGDDKPLPANVIPMLGRRP